MSYELAVFNIARFRESMDHPSNESFVAELDPLNALADAAPGFVWRLVDEEGNDATSITFYDDPRQLVNLSVWADIESVRNYVYKSAHVEMYQRRSEWADPLDQAWLVLWWVRAGHRPTVAEADERLQQLRANGPTPTAFTFGKHFPPTP